MSKRIRKRSDVGPYEPARKVRRDKFDRRLSRIDIPGGSGSIHLLWCEHRRLEYKLRSFVKRRNAATSALDMAIREVEMRRRLLKQQGVLLKARFTSGLELNDEPVGGLRVVKDGLRDRIDAYQVSDFGPVPALADNIQREKGKLVVREQFEVDVLIDQENSLRATRSVGRTNTGAPFVVTETVKGYAAGVDLDRDFDVWRGRWPRVVRPDPVAEVAQANQCTCDFYHLNIVKGCPYRPPVEPPKPRFSGRCKKCGEIVPDKNVNECRRCWGRW